MQSYKAGGKFMGTQGGYRGWAMKVTPDGEVSPFASGLRSPAGLATGPDGKLYYTDNQGEYNGTSKLYVLEEGKFYGHPSSLVDLPGMTPASPEIQWETVAETKEKAVTWLPHNRVSNSPGSPSWDTTEGQFGPFAGDLFLGDQTLSTLFRIQPKQTDAGWDSAIIPFAKQLPSGVMRLTFTPEGQLYIGQTGRGWRAAGGQQDALIRMTHNGSISEPLVKSIQREGKTFTLQLTDNLSNEIDLQNVSVSSWSYTDSPNYGSPEENFLSEKIASAELGENLDVLTITLEENDLGEISNRVYEINVPGLVGLGRDGFTGYYSISR